MLMDSPHSIAVLSNPRQMSETRHLTHMLVCLYFAAKTVGMRDALHGAP